MAPPNSHYDKSTAPNKTHPRATAPDVLFTFMRGTPCAQAVEAVKNKNLLPKRVIKEGLGLPDNCPLPDSMPWDNYDQCLLTFLAFYLRFEGLLFSHSVARALLIYCYYGMYFFVRTRRVNGQKIKVTKEMPIIHGLYNKCSQNQTRSLKTINTNFASFITLLTKKPEYKQFLSDKGVGNAPEEYNVAIEAGIRNYARDPQALSKLATSSAQDYDRVQKWRKRACYECLCRVVEGVKACKWFTCSWEYYLWRLDRGITFDKRHWPLCQRSSIVFKGKVAELEEWSTKKTKKRKRTASSAKPNQQRYDAEAGCFVPS